MGYGGKYDGNVGLCGALRSLPNSENMIRILTKYDEQILEEKYYEKKRKLDEKVSWENIMGVFENIIG